MTTITIPKKLDNNKDLIAIPRKEYESLLKAAEMLEKENCVTENDIIRWSKEAKKLKKAKKLPALRSLKDLR